MSANLTHTKPTLESLGIKRPPKNSCFSICVTGPPKQGKTHFATTFPEPVFIVGDLNHKAHESYGVEYYVADTWDDYENNFRSAIQNRIFPGKSIIIDTGSALFRKLERKYAKNGMALEGFQEWNYYRGSVLKFADDLNAARQPTADHPGYNICVLMHEKPDGGAESADKKPLRYLPDMSSKLDANFAGLFDAAFHTSIETVNEVNTDPSGKPSGGTTATNHYFLHSVPRTPAYEKICGDNLGGAGKKYAQLPPKFTNDFVVLMDLWNTNQQEKQDG